MSTSLLMKYVLPPKQYPGSFNDCNRKTIILDLDSTLVYTFIDRPQGYNGQDCWFVDQVIEQDNSITKYYVLIRPYAKQFLQRCMGHYNVVFFTAAQRQYAQPIFNMLCPQISPQHRYYRDSCVMQSSVYIKDLNLLTGLKFDQRKVFLFDDNAPDNTIPRENGMFCSQFAPEDENDNSKLAISNLLKDKALQAFADLFCSDRFLKAEDIRIPLAQYDDLYRKRLAEFGET